MTNLVERLLDDYQPAAQFRATGRHFPPVKDIATLRAERTEAADEITRLTAALGEREWRPIETAPTNESVLVFIPNAEHYGHGVYRAMLVDMGTGRRWMTTGCHIGRDCSPDTQPTHWQPLPPAPEVTQ